MVISTLVINSVVQKGPIIFLSLAQGSVGEYDGYLIPSTHTGQPSLGEPTQLNKYTQTTRFLDYAKVESYYGEATYNLAPRYHMCQINVGTVFEGCIMAFDTDREQDIDLGVSYPFEKLNKGECLISEEWKGKGAIREGSTIPLLHNHGSFWSSLLQAYNEDPVNEQSKINSDFNQE